MTRSYNRGERTAISKMGVTSLWQLHSVFAPVQGRSSKSIVVGQDPASNNIRGNKSPVATSVYPRTTHHNLNNARESSRSLARHTFTRSDDKPVAVHARSSITQLTTAACSMELRTLILPPILALISPFLWLLVVILGVAIAGFLFDGLQRCRKRE